MKQLTIKFNEEEWEKIQNIISFEEPLGKQIKKILLTFKNNKKELGKKEFQRTRRR